MRVLVDSPGVVLTARHCVETEGQRLRVRFTTGSTRSAWVVAIDEVADQALLLVEDPPAITPLPLVRRRQIVGTVLYFEGNPTRPRFQHARLDRIGRCPSLPDLPNALFTSIRGVPGDSGAPLVDAAARVVGLVHGGAQCHIATPADTLGRLIDRVLGSEDVQMAGGTLRARSKRLGRMLTSTVGAARRDSASSWCAPDGRSPARITSAERAPRQLRGRLPWKRAESAG